MLGKTLCHCPPVTLRLQGTLYFASLKPNCSACTRGSDVVMMLSCCPCRLASYEPCLGDPQHGESSSPDSVAEGDNRLAPLRDQEHGCAHCVGRGGHDSHSSEPFASKQGTFFRFGFQGSPAVRFRCGSVLRGSVVAVPVLRFRFGSTAFLVTAMYGGDMWW